MSDLSRVRPFFNEAPTVYRWELSPITMLTMEALWAQQNGLLKRQWGEGDVMQFLWLHWPHNGTLLRLGALYRKVWAARIGRQVSDHLVEVTEGCLRMIDEAWQLRILPNNDDETNQKLDVAWVARMTVGIATHTGWSEKVIHSMPLAKVMQYRRAIYTEVTGKQHMTLDDIEAQKAAKAAVTSGDADQVRKWLQGEI